jgi:hypothetical protein
MIISEAVKLKEEKSVACVTHVCMLHLCRALAFFQICASRKQGNLITESSGTYSAVDK